MKLCFCQDWIHIIDIDLKVACDQFDNFGIFIGNAFIGSLARGRGVFSGNNTNAITISNNHFIRKDDLSGADNGRID